MSRAEGSERSGAMARPPRLPRPSPSSRSYSHPVEDQIYKNDSLRLLSFVSWTNSNVSRESLALAGFYYVGGVRGERGDNVRCAWCSGEIDNWLIGDCPITEHLRHYPSCNYAKEMASRSNITLSQQCNDDLLIPSNMSALGISTHRAPMKPMYATPKSRLDTFGRWPSNIPQNPDSLANAGFYYTGSEDEVRCFHCDIGLRNWEPTDNPWTEHAKHFPDCTFLTLVKGRDFVDSVRKSVAATRIRNAGENTFVRNRIHTVTDADINNFMESPVAIIALHCGVQPDRIRSAIRTRLLQTGTPFVSPDNLIDAALNVQVNETPFSFPEPATVHHASSSSQYDIDNDTIDQVTRMIINSALGDSNDLSRSSLIDAEETLSDVGNAIDIPDNNSVHEESSSDMDNAIDPLYTTSSDITDQNILPSRNCRADLEGQMENLNASIPAPISVFVPSNKPVSLEEENKRLKDARMCKICMDSEVSVVFLPCGHLVSCVVCATGIHQCPICRGGVKGIVRTYLS